jgi:8-oxo-dGTP pyrophosphatase MutT (NUDIX family)
MSKLSELPVRNAVRALIYRDEQILLLRKHDQLKGERFALPGGSQELGETLQQALARECLEEIGVEVELRDLLHLGDWFKPRSSDPGELLHMVEFLFLCEVPDDYQPHNGHCPDKHQVEVVWMPLQRLPDLPLPPASLPAILAGSAKGQVYLGPLEGAP